MKIDFKKYKWPFYIFTFFLVTVVATVLSAMKPGDKVPDVSNAILLVGAFYVGVYLIHKLFKSFRNKQKDEEIKKIETKNNKNRLSIILICLSLVFLALSTPFRDIGYFLGSLLVILTGWTIILGIIAYLIWKFGFKKREKLFLFIFSVLFLSASLFEFTVNTFEGYVAGKVSEMILDQPTSIQNNEKEFPGKNNIQVQSSKNTDLEIEKCKIASENASVWDETTRIAEEWNQINAGLRAQGIIPTQEDTVKFYNENVEKYRNKLYEDCLNKI